MAKEHDALMMSNLYRWGMPAFFRAPHLPPEGQGIALVGVPHSTRNGTTEHDQHLGPRASRNVSAVQRRVHGVFGTDPWSAAKIADVGDVAFTRSNDNEHRIQQITDFYKRIDAAGARPVSAMGDHSITGGIVQALGCGKLAGGEPVSFLHPDAHADVFTKVDHFLGAHTSAAHGGAYLADQGQVDP
jgi:guanidinopropionase